MEDVKPRISTRQVTEVLLREVIHHHAALLKRSHLSAAHLDTGVEIEPRLAGTVTRHVAGGVERDVRRLVDHVAVGHVALRAVAGAAVDDVAVDTEIAVVEVTANDQHVGGAVGVDGQRHADDGLADAVAVREAGGAANREAVLGIAAGSVEVAEDERVEVRGEVEPFTGDARRTGDVATFLDELDRGIDVFEDLAEVVAHATVTSVQGDLRKDIIQNVGVGATCLAADSPEEVGR